MAKEDEVVMEDDYVYLAVCPISGPAREEDGCVCVIEMGDDGLAPEDPKARFLMVTQAAAENLIQALTNAIRPSGLPQP